MPPIALLRKPALYTDLDDVWAAFTLLSGCRQATLAGLGPISLQDTEAYFRLHNITDPEDIDDFLFYLRALDSAWLKARRSKGGK